MHCEHVTRGAAANSRGNAAVYRFSVNAAIEGIIAHQRLTFLFGRELAAGGRADRMALSTITSRGSVAAANKTAGGGFE